MVTGLLVDESLIRWQLAACYRLIDHFGMTDLVSTHISARVPGTDIILINRYGLLFHEITASNLVAISLSEGVDENGEPVNPAGFLIHGAIHGARHDVQCVIHTHTVAGTALSCQDEGLLPISQHALQFYDRLAYHDYEGIALLEAEKERLVADLGDHRVMILRNHGLLTAGRTIGEALLLMFNLERACQIQLRAMAGGAALTAIAPEVCELTARQHDGFADQEAGEPEWSALIRFLDRVAPDYRS